MAPKTYTSSLPPTPESSFDPGPPNNSSSSSHTPQDKDCPFCHISSTFPAYDPASPPPASSPFLNSSLTSPQPATFIVLSTPTLIAFLDIMPLSLGHILLCPRRHCGKLTDTTPDEAAELGRYLRVLSAAVVEATGVGDWNVVQNNGAAAAQVVPHMHFHVIPRPELRDKRSERFTATMFGRGQRDELDEEEAGELAERVRRKVAEVMAKSEAGREGRAKL
ncbi:Hit family protein 1 [Madurella mycetomatis]|uniref:Hit family protein 1 n=1 Tax=Madurella mycetomatis TaxID=100816 RepID=A0A175W4J6_9PEZI|nr:Hit family protein 1 [Madurella mycetomatis]